VAFLLDLFLGVPLQAGLSAVRGTFASHERSELTKQSLTHSELPSALHIKKAFPFPKRLF